MISSLNKKLHALNMDIEGDIRTDDLYRTLYATDASVYREIPIGVAFPKSELDLIHLVKFCKEESLSLIPRAAGTSLAGQVVGNGLICDISKYLNRISDINVDARTVTLQPGVIRDELNSKLAEHGLFFGPNTSTSNRCMIGGMIGNNSCGSTSIKYGTTRDKISSIRAVLSNAEVSVFDDNDIHADPGTMKGRIVKAILNTYADPLIRKKVLDAFPNPTIERRNTGYALDVICQSLPFESNGLPLNLSRLLCGSEGTLALTTQATLHLDPLPPKHYNMVSLEFDSVNAALQSVGSIMNFEPYQCELMDEVVLNCTLGHPKFGPYLDLLKGQPKAVVLVELRGASLSELDDITSLLCEELTHLGLARSISVLSAENSDKMWSLRKAGLGLLANIDGDDKAVACIEDTAVSLDDLPAYIEEFDALMKSFGQKAVYYAHAGAGELHLRPILNLKRSRDVARFEEISRASSRLVKKYNGSLSGEHGDGRVRAPFIKDMVGSEVYSHLVDMKREWDPENLFNPGKIVNAPPITTSLRYVADVVPNKITTAIDFNAQGGILEAAEKCNGSGDCRKLSQSGGTMCPSYQATKDEKDSTRARANMLREVLTNSNRSNRFVNDDLKDVLDMCLSCKACQNECPSRVDMALMKSEFLYQYHKVHNRQLRDYIFAYTPDIADTFNLLFNWGVSFINSKWGNWIKPLIGIHPNRSIPGAKQKKINGIPKNQAWSTISPKDFDIILYLDEFTYNFDSELITKAIVVLEKLGYKVLVSPKMNSGRSLISKGFLDRAIEEAKRHLTIFENVIYHNIPIVGLEPSSILTLRDELPKLVGEADRTLAYKQSKLAFTIEEFLWDEYEKGHWKTDHFTNQSEHYHIHAHCHFKALGKEDSLYHLISILPGSHSYKISSGCCGMAGSFGFEKEKYALSMSIANETLFPYISKLSESDHIVAHGTSCRQQIVDGLNKSALHPIEVLYRRLIQ